MNKCLILIILFLLGSCSFFKSKAPVTPQVSSGEKFVYSDKNGKYLIKIQSGINPKDKTYYYKKSIEIPNKSKENILEQSITISELGHVKKTNVLRPKQSQYSVWFDGKKYFSELKVIPKKKSIELKMQSPEANWNGTKIIKFPNTKMIPCFFSQIIECARTSGFFDLVARKPHSKMSVLIIWEGYPYLNETYTDLPSELFSNGELELDEGSKSNEKKINLTVAGQSIFYVLDRDYKFKKMFWVSQGITMIEKSQAESLKNNDGEDVE